MGEWKEYKLGEIADVTPGFAFKSKDFGSKGELVVKIKDIIPPYIDLSNSDRVDLTNYDMDKLKKYLLSEGDYVVAMTGATIGKVGKMKTHQKAFLNQRVAKIKAKEGFCDDFVYYSISGSDFQTFIQNNIDSNSAQENISANSIARFPVMLPSLDIQRCIASILASLDDKIDLLHRENATLEQMAVTLYRQWFIVEAKEDWKEGKLGDIIDVKSGFAFKSSSFVDFGLYRLITIKAVQDGFLTLENADYISEIPDNIKDYCFLKEGDILLSLTGNVGRCCFVDRERLLLNQRVALLCAKDTKNWAFVYTLFRMQSMKIKLEEMAKGTAQPNLSPVELSNMQFEIPPTKLLEGFSETATPLLKKTLSNKKQIQTLIQTRDELLPRLMLNEIVL